LNLSLGFVRIVEEMFSARWALSSVGLISPIGISVELYRLLWPIHSTFFQVSLRLRRRNSLRESTLRKEMD